MKQTPLNRLSYSGPLDPLLLRVCHIYDIGHLETYSTFSIGYEDCNILLTATNGRFVVKIFSKQRTSESITRYVDIMERVTAAGIHHPTLYKTTSGTHLYVDEETSLSLVIMSYIEGSTFLELNRPPTEEERQRVIEQATRINALDFRPSEFFDTWAIPNIESMLERVQMHLQPTDLTLVHEVITRYKQLPLSSLPHCFVHGDFTKANVMRRSDGTIFILDFSVSNWYPRIQELAIIAENLLFNPDHLTPLKETCDRICFEYDKLLLLTADERTSLPTYALAGAAMEFLGAHQEKYLKGNDTEETTYWLNLGRTTLQTELL